MKPIIIPHQQLSEDALTKLIEDYVTRDGTDYGQVESSLSAKTERIRRQLQSEKIVIVFNSESETCSIISKDRIPN